MAITAIVALSLQSWQTLVPHLPDRLQVSVTADATYSWAELLYRTLVRHEAIPDGYMAEFVALANSCQGAAERQAAKGAKITNVEAALILHNRQSELEREQKTLTMSENMFLQSIGDRPRAYRSTLQKAWFEGQTPDAMPRNRNAHAG